MPPIAATVAGAEAERKMRASQYSYNSHATGHPARRYQRTVSLLLIPPLDISAPAENTNNGITKQ